MKKVSDILNNIELLKVSGDTGIGFNQVQFDSRLVGKDDVFVAVPGTQVDGHHYIDKAIAKGAKAVVCQQLPENIQPDITYVVVKDTSYALGMMASAYYGQPSRKLKLIGVTGTNGKTTVATLLYEMLMNLGIKSGLISTVVYKISEQVVEATHTTPDALTINRLLSRMAYEECQYVVMEVSSHALAQNRVAGLYYTAGIFTNITHDHLDYHATFQEYIRAKKKLFDSLSKNAFALVNIDDKNAGVMVQETNAAVYSYSLKTLSDFKTRIIEQRLDGSLLEINGKETWVPLVGEFNAYNLTAVYGCAQLFGFEGEETLRMLSLLKPVKGRFETLISAGDKTAIVDYAHTPAGLLNVLKTIHKIKSKQQQIYTVVGAGGNRDTQKRPEMGKIAEKYSHKVILTNDNPRYEEPGKIVEGLLSGFKDQNNALVIVDRKEAIKTAIALAKSGDIILVAGKGHENYQEIQGKRFRFDDKTVISEIFNK